MTSGLLESGSVELGDGYRLRHGDAADRDAVIALQVQAHGESERWGLEMLWSGGPGSLSPDRWTVVEHGGEIVSCLCVLDRPFVMRHGEVAIELAGDQPEYVATAADHRGRGLVRAQLDAVHRWSAARGDLISRIGGIPYFYRRFGYEYAAALSFVGQPPGLSAPADLRVRPATLDDLSAIVVLDATDTARADLATPRSPSSWLRMIEGGAGCPFRTVVAERAGEVVAVGQQADWDEPWLVTGNIAAVDPDAALAVIAALGSADRPVLVMRQPRTAAGAITDGFATATRTWGEYFRIADPVAVIAALRPILDARLADSPFSTWSGRIEISTYAAGIGIDVERGVVGAVSAVDGEQDPHDTDGVGVAPDLIATLLLGRHGASGLEARHDDVTLGRHRGLLDVLFPALVTVLPHDV